jgi:hypothetical protein
MLFITGSGPLALDNWIHGRTATVDTSTTGTEEAPDVEEPAAEVEDSSPG